MGSSFLTRLVIVFLVVAALVGLAHLGGSNSAMSFLMKIHGKH